MYKRILVIGYFGYVSNQLDGQTVKTRDILQLLQMQYSDSQICYYDTQQFQYKRLSILRMFRQVCSCDTLVYLPANNNLKYIFPIIFFLSVIFRFKIQYFVVGGWLCNYISNLPIHRWMLKRIKGIHVETSRLKNDLEYQYGFENVDIFPNFRFFDFSPNTVHAKELRLVFMARIMRKKGLDWIFELAEFIFNNSLSHEINITFFGQINETDQNFFFSEIEKYDFVSYKGVLQPNEIHHTLSQYDVMLLPTHFYTEGLPGSVVDAYISGIPVIVSEWLNAHEFVDDGKSGFIVPFENGQKELIDKVILLNNDRDLLNKMQLYALNKRNEFAPPQIFL